LLSYFILFRFLVPSVFSSQPLPSSVPETDDWFVFPRQREGRVYSVNWSLNEDNVVPTGENAFHNARLQLLLNRFPNKVPSSSESIEVKSPSFEGSSATVLEAGDSISHEEFKQLAKDTQSYLSSGMDLFVEDNVVGSHQQYQLGVRVITEDPSIALLARTFMVSLLMISV
jgi:hypothetical protein